MMTLDEINRMPRVTPEENAAFMAAVVTYGHRKAVREATEWLKSGKPRPEHRDSPWSAHIWAEAERGL